MFFPKESNGIVHQITFLELSVSHDCRICIDEIPQRPRKDVILSLLEAEAHADSRLVPHCTKP